MNSKNSFSRRSFIVIMLFMAVTLLSIDLFYDSGIGIALDKAFIVSGIQGVDPGLPETIAGGFKELKPLITLIVAGVLFCFGFFLWGALRLSMPVISSEKSPEKKSKPAAVSEKPAENKLERMESDRRMYLHLLSVFQREGRLVDFFAEDLSLYEDAQIGAAVRSIHENCKKSMEKYLKPGAVMDQNEGDEVTIDASYNADEVKLIGNVSGTPPFKGVLRHKGWKAGKSELPKLSAGKDSRLIAPAEVEIL